MRAGRDWGRALAPPPRRTAPVDGLVQVLDGLGFTPAVVHRDNDSAVLHLRSCPFLELAEASPDVVCGVHLGVIGGAPPAPSARHPPTPTWSRAPHPAPAWSGSGPAIPLRAIPRQRNGRTGDRPTYRPGRAAAAAGSGRRAGLLGRLYAALVRLVLRGWTPKRTGVLEIVNCAPPLLVTAAALR